MGRLDGRVAIVTGAGGGIGRSGSGNRVAARRVKDDARQRDQHGLAGDEICLLHRVPHREDEGIRGAHARIHLDAAARAQRAVPAVRPIGAAPPGHDAHAAAGFASGPMAVNVSALEFRDKGFVAGLEAILAQTGLPANALQLELSESALMREAQFSSQILQQLR